MPKYDNSGIIAKNKDKKQDNHPDIRGQATIDGTEYWISGWAKTSDKGPFYSLSFQPKDNQQQTSRNAGTSKQQDEDDIPF